MTQKTGLRMVKKCKGNICEAARRLGVSRTYLRRCIGREGPRMGMGWGTVSELKMLQRWYDAGKHELLVQYRDAALVRVEWGCINREKVLAWLDEHIPAHYRRAA